MEIDAANFEPSIIDDTAAPYHIEPDLKATPDSPTGHAKSAPTRHSIVEHQTNLPVEMSSYPILSDADAMHFLSKVPSALFDPPILPPDCQWVCPVPGCLSLFDLKGKLPRQVLEHLTFDEIEFLKTRGFTSKSHRAISIFLVLVDIHYNQHLMDLGIVADSKVSRIHEATR
ncbi:hypothetical protein M408DRAFT_88006 [Serendipita vermifera MAFF 305830]|uniref:Uncharacterized protein n=1 Tax=Serendipita vermifera MAFF 305830 TaxID=933852 RepID=A0A0C3BR54_SERVB|nr:hypothetical protein M408DRAFT_88006 [Serendipita vermifera MAFF 305830]